MMKLVLLATLLAVGGLAAVPAAEAHEYVCVPTMGCTEVSNLVDNCYVYVPNVRSSYCIL